MGKIVKYSHHNRTVAVDEKLKGKHREHCLCFRCDLFAPNQQCNCAIAQQNFTLCQTFGMTTPVYECPYFVEGEPDLSGLG